MCRQQLEARRGRGSGLRCKNVNSSTMYWSSGNMKCHIACGVATLVVFAVGSTANAAVRSGFDASSLARNDDGSTDQLSLGFNIDLWGSTYSQLYANNNGNVTFDGPLWTFTPFDLTSTSTKIIAPFFGHVDTRDSGSGLLRYGSGTVNGRQAFGVTWDGVGYYSSNSDKLNKFQLVLIERHDTGAGNFDIEFSYDQIQWESGNASGGRVDWVEPLPASAIPTVFPGRVNGPMSCPARA